MGTFVERLLYIIDANPDGANRGMDEFADKAELAADRAALAKARVADLERTLQRRPNSAATAARLEIARRDAQRAELAAASLVRASEGGSRAGDLLTQVGVRAGVSGKALDAMGRAGITAGRGVAIGSAAAVAGLGLVTFKATRGFSEYASSVREFQRASGASAEDASRFVAVLDDLEIEASAAANAVFKLGRIDPAKLREFGVEVARNRDGGVDLTATLLNVSDAYNATLDPARRSEIAFAAFGRQGRDLVPLLEQGREGLERFFAGAEEHHQVLSQEEINKAREFDLAIDELSDTWAGFGRDLGALAAGPLTFVINRLSDVVAAARWAGGLLGNVLGVGDAEMPTTIAETEAALRQLAAAQAEVAASGGGGPLGGMLSENVANLQKHLEELRAGQNNSADAARRAADALRYEQEQADAAAQSMLDAATATLTTARGQLSLERASLAVAHAQAALAATREQEVQQQRSLRDAEERLADARRRAADAATTVAERQRDYNNVVRGFGASSKEAVAAHRELNDAMDASRGAALDIADAQDRYSDAVQAYNEAVAQFGASSEEADDARRALARAQFDSAQASERERDAREAEAEAQKKATETIKGTGPASDAARTAMDALRQAQEQQRQAALAVRGAHESYGDALRAGTGLALQRRSAELALREAHIAQQETYVTYARTVADAAKAQAEANGVTFTAQDYNAKLADALKQVTANAPAAARALQGYFDVLGDATTAQDEAVRAAYGRHLRDNMEGMAGFGSVSLTIPLSIDGRAFATAVVPDIQSVIRQNQGRGAALS